MRISTVASFILASAATVLAANIAVDGGFISCAADKAGASVPLVCSIGLTTVTDKQTRNDKACGGTSIQALLQQCAQTGTFTNGGHTQEALQRNYTAWEVPPECWGYQCNVSHDDAAD